MSKVALPFDELEIEDADGYLKAAYECLSAKCLAEETGGVMALFADGRNRTTVVFSADDKRVAEQLSPKLLSALVTGVFNISLHDKANELRAAAEREVAEREAAEAAAVKFAEEELQAVIVETTEQIAKLHKYLMRSPQVDDDVKSAVAKKMLGLILAEALSSISPFDMPTDFDSLAPQCDEDPDFDDFDDFDDGITLQCEEEPFDELDFDMVEAE